ncbi:hypothetical protein GBAR_LOCUS29051, partial [Geodia barretti]
CLQRKLLSSFGVFFDKANQDETNNDGGNSSHLEIILPVVIAVLILISLLVIGVLIVTYVLKKKGNDKQTL